MIASAAACSTHLAASLNQFIPHTRRMNNGSPSLRKRRVMTRLSRPYGWVIPIVLAITAACGDTLGPDEISGVYDLRKMNGRPMPYDHEGLGCCTYLNGALKLESRRYVISITARNRNNGIVTTATEWGQFQLQTTHVVFERDSFDVAPFLLDTALIQQDTISMAFGGEGPGSPDQFDASFVRRE